MKFQDSNVNGLKVTVGTKSVTHPRTHAPKAICPINFFKVGGIKTWHICPTFPQGGRAVVTNDIMQTCPCNIQQYFTAVKILIFR